MTEAFGDVWSNGAFSRTPSPLVGEGWGEGASASIESITPHPDHFVIRPLPTGEVKKSTLSGISR